MNKSKYQKAFTLIELLIAMAMLVIVVAIGAPSMSSLLKSNELKGGLSVLYSALAFARDEAVTRRSQVTICGTKDALVCSEEPDMTSGWLIFSDVNENGKLDLADCNPILDCVLRIQEPISSGATLTASANWIAYGRNGELDIDGASSIRLCRSDAEAVNDSNRSLTINIAASGNARSSKGSTKCP